MGMQPSKVVVLILGLALMVRAALPPLSQQELNERATDVVAATIMNVKSSVEEVPEGEDRVYQLNIRVDEARKGMLRSGLTVTVIARQTGRRPEGWTGPQGQNEIPAEGARVWLYLHEEQNQFFLLEPNGWAPR